MEKHQGRWHKQHRLVMERDLGRPLLKGEVVHHKDEDRLNNDLSNLELMTDAQHRSHHAVGRKISEETKSKMSLSAKRIAANPEERQRRSARAKQQWEQGRLGRRSKK
jgi:hypothetical protein